MATTMQSRPRVSVAAMGTRMGSGGGTPSAAVGSTVVTDQGVYNLEHPARTQSIPV